MKNKLKIAIQNKGRLKDYSLEYLRKVGLDFEVGDRQLIVSCKNMNVEILFVRYADIPVYVAQGVADYGIVGENLLYEIQCKFEMKKKLGFGPCSLVIAVPNGSKINRPESLEGERIATTYPCSLKKYLKRVGISAAIVEIRGSAEIAPQLNLADAICDLTQSGKTLRENGLRVIDKVLDSEAVLISNLKYETILS